MKRFFALAVALFCGLIGTTVCAAEPARDASTNGSEVAAFLGLQDNQYQTLSESEANGIRATGGFNSFAFPRNFAYGYAPSYSRGFGPGIPQGFGPGAPRGYMPGYPQGFGAGYPRGYTPSYPQGFGAGYPRGYAGYSSPRYSHGHSHGGLLDLHAGLNALGLINFHGHASVGPRIR
jgi:hypothetical protein